MGLYQLVINYMDYWLKASVAISIEPYELGIVIRFQIRTLCSKNNKQIPIHNFFP